MFIAGILSLNDFVDRSRKRSDSYGKGGIHFAKSNL